MQTMTRRALPGAHCVIFTGPEPDRNNEGDEVPSWWVAPWLGKMIADGAHKGTVMPNDCVRTLQMVEALIAKAPAPSAEAYERIAGPTETKHTPLPWHANHLEQETGIHSIHSAAGCIAECQRGAMDNISIDEREANTAFIVRACNAHYDLMAAALNAVERFRVIASAGYGSAPEERELLAALAKAKGQL